MAPLPTLGGSNGEASSINNRGQIAGGAENTTTGHHLPSPPTVPVQACLWENGQIQELPIPGLDPNGFASSRSTTTVRRSARLATCAGLQPNGTYLLSRHALLWQTGRVTDLGTLGGKEGNFAYASITKGRWWARRTYPVTRPSMHSSGRSVRGCRTLARFPVTLRASALGINDGGEWLAFPMTRTSIYARSSGKTV